MNIPKDLKIPTSIRRNRTARSWTETRRAIHLIKLSTSIKFTMVRRISKTCYATNIKSKSIISQETRNSLPPSYYTPPFSPSILRFQDLLFTRRRVVFGNRSWLQSWDGLECWEVLDREGWRFECRIRSWWISFGDSLDLFISVGGSFVFCKELVLMKRALCWTRSPCGSA